jgi:plasmid stabilization system protein ParE
VKLVYTEEAVDDLKHLRRFIAIHKPQAAAKMAKQLTQRIELLPTSPRMGTPVTLAPDPETVRDLVLGDYVLRSSLHDHTIIILWVWHGLEEERTATNEV